jgi:hypothetical protein
MKTRFLNSLFALAAMVLLQANPLHAGNPGTDDAIEFVNARLSHSYLMRIDPNGGAKIKAPGGQTFTFNIKDVAFSFNDRNDDARIRVASDQGIGLQNEDRDKDDRFRQSFVCRSSKAAREAIDSLRKLKKTFTERDDRFKHLDRKLVSGDAELTFTTLGEAIDFVNDRLAISVVTRVDTKGFLFINGPDKVYQVDLRKAEFGFNPLSDDPKVRIYGDWCLALLHHGKMDREIARESFTTGFRQDAYQVIKALYFIQGAFTGMDAAQIKTLRNVTRSQTKEYSTIQGALDAINDRLAISIVLGIDPKGLLTINASEHIYRLDIAKCSFEKARPKRTFQGWLQRTFSFDDQEGVTITCPDGIQKCADAQSSRTVEEETFSCESAFDTREIIKALEFIKDKVRAGNR